MIELCGCLLFIRSSSFKNKHEENTFLYMAVRENIMKTSSKTQGSEVQVKEGQILSGPTKELLTRENIEKAYQVPMDMLHQRENLYRDHLLKDKSEIEGLSGINTKVYE